LSQVDGADPRQPAQQLGSWVLGDPLLDRCLQLADGGLQAPQQLDLGADQLGEHRRRQPDRWGRCCPQPGQEFGGWLAAPVGVAAAERGQAGLAEPGGRLWGWIVGQEGQRDVAGQLAEHGLGSGPVGVQQRAQLVAGGGASTT
jgi:hypothetical protein